MYAPYGYCPDLECSFCEQVEVNTPCPKCGSIAKPIHFLSVTQLIEDKKRNQKVREIMLFHEAQSVDSLIDKRNELIKDLAEIESKKYRKDEDEAKILIILGKIEVIQSELTFLAMNELAEKLCRLFGV